MKESHLNIDEVQFDLDEQLEPTTLGQVSEVTGPAPDGQSEMKNV